MREKNISFDGFEEWKAKNFAEYEKMYQIHYEKDYLKEIEKLTNRLKDRLNDKEIICFIDCYDADPNYDILANMEQCILMF